MEINYDYKKYAILYVDDEKGSLKYFVEHYGKDFRIFTAASAAEGWAILQEKQHEIAMLLTDQRMPGEKGVALLEKTRRLSPRIVRVLVTAYSDIDAAIAAVNSGYIYRYVGKPWDPPQLLATLRRGIEFHILQRERDELLREKMSALHNLILTDRVMSLGILAAGLGHHLRNSLVAVRTFVDLAPARLQDERVDVERLRNPNFWREFHGHVQQQMQRLLGMLNDLGAAANQSSYPFSDQVQLATQVNQALAHAAAGLTAKKISVTTAIPADLPELSVDLPKFKRLLELLIQDELANLPEGGTIQITAAKATGPAGEPQVCLELRDNGPGLPEEGLRSIFDPFFVRVDKPDEFGINLMVCYFIVHHHSGRIEVQNQAGTGVTFRLTFPLQPPSARVGLNEQDFLNKVMLNERLWDRLLAGE